MDIGNPGPATPLLRAAERGVAVYWPRNVTKELTACCGAYSYATHVYHIGFFSDSYHTAKLAVRDRN